MLGFYLYQPNIITFKEVNRMMTTFCNFKLYECKWQIYVIIKKKITYKIKNIGKKECELKIL